MKLLGVTYKGPELEQHGIFRTLPDELKLFLNQVNGIIAYKGGLHIRGCCSDPIWHSIDEVWSGKQAFWKHYADILDIDVPFAQDCMGDQYFLRNKKVIKLNAETGEVKSLEVDLKGFLEESEKDPLNFLGMQPLLQFKIEGGILEPGKLLSAYPPFCLNQSEDVVLEDMPVMERLKALAELSRQIRGLSEDGEVQFIVE